MCNISERPVNTRPVSESVRNCSTSEHAQIRSELDGLKAENAQLRTDLNQLKDRFDATHGPSEFAQAPGSGCLQPPSMNQSGAPAGKGLQTNPTGWPEGSVRTAGGYTVVPEGKDAAWSIFAPDAKPGDKPTTRIWGDPHVDEKDGTRWDFTKNSNFRLPDGTMITATTTSQTGQSVSKGLNIVNGSDRVNIDGIDGNKPHFVNDAGCKVDGRDAVTRDGYEFRNKTIENNPCRDTFVLGGDGDKNVSWFRERHGEIEGLVTGSKSNVDGKGSYDQTIDSNFCQLEKDGKIDAFGNAVVDPKMMPPVGSRAWGNMLRSEVVDAASNFLPRGLSGLVTAGVSLDDASTKFRQSFQDQARQQFGQDHCFGGLGRIFGGGDLFDSLASLGGLGNNMLDQWSLMSLFGQNRSQSMFC